VWVKQERTEEWIFKKPHTGEVQKALQIYDEAVQKSEAHIP
jgi:hypothetical protein